MVMPRKATLRNDLGLVTKSQLAVLLSAEAGREVSLRQVWAWHDRRAKNGFPEAEAIEYRRRGVRAEVFDPDAVLAWHKTYVPLKGGRPRAA
jgi:hypothetical protein